MTAAKNQSKDAEKKTKTAAKKTETKKTTAKKTPAKKTTIKKHLLLFLMTNLPSLSVKIGKIYVLQAAFADGTWM